MLLTFCIYVNILFLIPFSLLLLSLFSSLSDECGWNKMHFKVLLWSFHNMFFLWQSLGRLFLGVFISRDRKGKKHLSVLFCSFFSSPWSLEPVCILLSPLLFFLSRPDSPTIYDGFTTVPTGWFRCAYFDFRVLTSYKWVWKKLYTSNKGLIKFQ